MTERESIYDLFAQVKKHPDYRFGVIFVKDDLNEKLTEDQHRTAERYLTQEGFEVISNLELEVK